MVTEPAHPEQAFGRALRRLRTGYGISQEQLATASGLDRTFISLLERGHRQPSLPTLLSIAAAFDMRLQDLAQEIESELGQRHS